MYHMAMFGYIELASISRPSTVLDITGVPVTGGPPMLMSEAVYINDTRILILFADALSVFQKNHIS